MLHVAVPRLPMLALATILLVAPGCTSFRDYVHHDFKVGPSYCHPQGTTAPQWIDAADRRIRSESTDLTGWWRVFQDPTLDRLIDSAAGQNLSLREAGWRVLQARAQLCFAQGSIFPQTQQAGGQYQRVADSGAKYSTPGVPSAFLDQWNLGFNLSWELDFWGRYRRAIASAEETLNASVANYQDVLVTMLGDVATYYVQVRTLEKRIELLHANVDLQQKVVTIAERRRAAGKTGELDVAQARSTLSQTAAQIPLLVSDRREACDRLCVLLGVPPTNLAAELGTQPIPNAPAEVVVGIPADLLRRRPDVRRAEYETAAQAEKIGIAEADLYPIFSINGTVGYEARDFSNLFASNAFAGTVGPAVQWNILNYGRIRSLVRFQEARFQELLAAYQRTVIQANAEVENGLVRFLQAQERTQLLNQAVADYQKAVDIVVQQYEHGVTDLNRVSLIQQNLVQQQDLQTQSQGQIAGALIRVYQALGGGWMPQEPSGPLPDAAAVAPLPAAPGVSNGPSLPSLAGTEVSLREERMAR